MQVELYCNSCVANYQSNLDSCHTEEMLNQIVDEGPAFSMGDGETLEDQLSARLQDDLDCPCCGGPVQVLQTSLGLLSLQLLAQW